MTQEFLTKVREYYDEVLKPFIGTEFMDLRFAVVDQIMESNGFRIWMFHNGFYMPKKPDGMQADKPFKAENTFEEYRDKNGVRLYVLDVIMAKYKDGSGYFYAVVRSMDGNGLINVTSEAGVNLTVSCKDVEYVKRFDLQKGDHVIFLYEQGASSHSHFGKSAVIYRVIGPSTEGFGYMIEFADGSVMNPMRCSATSVEPYNIHEGTKIMVTGSPFENMNGSTGVVKSTQSKHVHVDGLSINGRVVEGAFFVFLRENLRIVESRER